MLILRIRVGNLLSTVLSIDEVFDHTRLEWARPEQGHQGNDVFKTVRAKTLDQLLHTSAFQLKYSRGLCALQQAVDRTIIKRYLIDIDRRCNVVALIDHRDSPIDDGKGSQT